MEFRANTLDNVNRVRTNDGGFVREKTYAVKASQTINKGDFVKLTSGVVIDPTVEQAIAIGSTDNEVTASGGNVGIMGRAMESIVTNAAGVEPATGRSTIAVAIFTLGNEFLLRTVDPAHDIDLDGSTAEVRDTAVGTSYELGLHRISATEWFYVAIITTTNGELRQVDKYPSQAVADDWGLAWYRCAISDTIQQV